VGGRRLPSVRRRRLDSLSAHADAGDAALILRVAMLLGALCSLALADGGKLLFQRKVGAFNISLFATPSPIRVGRVDLSVMVQTSAGQTPVLDADVRLHLVRREPDSISTITAPARHEQATNKLLYAAPLDLKSPGRYRTEISIQTKSDSAIVTGDLEVLPPEPPLLAYWPYFVALPLVALLFALNQRLKRKRRGVSPPERPSRHSSH
jgi:hypothetical protein